MITILHAASFSPPYGGNFVASLTALADACQLRGWRLAMALPASARERPWCRQLLDEGRQVEFVPENASVARFARELAQLATRTEASILHTHFTLFDVPAWIAGQVLRLRGRRVSVVWHRHSDFADPLTPVRRLKEFVKYRLMGQSVEIVAVTEHLRQMVIRSGMAEARVRAVLNGIDVRRVVTATRRPAEVRADLGLAPHDRLLLLFGWHPLVKGVDLAMDVVEELVKDGHPVVLAIVGWDALREFVQTRTGGRAPAWLRLIPPVENVADLFQAAEVFLSASRAEGFSYAVAEAMAGGVPVVASDLPAMAWAREIPGAQFFPAGDARRLAQSLRNVLGWSADQRRRATAACREYVCRELDVQVWVKRIMGVYEEMVRSKK